MIFQSISNPVNRRHGFSLVELMTTLALVAILIVIATNQVMGAKNTAYLAVMRADLHALVRAQEVYHATTDGWFGNDPNGGADGTYTQKEGQLDLTPSPNVTIRIRADADGWSARAEHANRASDRFFCAIYVGDINAFAPATDEGVVTCEPKRKKKKKKKSA